MITKTKKVLISLGLFFIAGVLEIGGAYLVWIWLRSDSSWLIGALGGFALFSYGIVQTFQPSYFHRIFIAYGGIFIIIALLTGWILEGITPDIFDIIGAIVSFIGMGIVFYWPRGRGKK